MTTQQTDYSLAEARAIVQRYNELFSEKACIDGLRVGGALNDYIANLIELMDLADKDEFRKLNRREPQPLYPSPCCGKETEWVNVYLRQCPCGKTHRF